MGIFSKFEDRMEDTVEGAASRMSKAPISPVQIAKKAEKQMRRETMVGAGKQFAPTLYTVLVNPDDDERLFGYYPTLAGETETYLSAKAAQEGLVMDGNPLVRFIVDEGLRHGKFDVIAELVAAPIIEQLREEEMERYGISRRPRQGAYGNQQHDDLARGQQPQQPRRQDYGYDQPQVDYGYDQPQVDYGYDQPQQGGYGYPQQQAWEQEPAQPQKKPPLPYVPEDEIDRSIDYGEYTFNSEDFEDYRNASDNPHEVPRAYNDDFAYNDAGYDEYADYGEWGDGAVVNPGRGDVEPNQYVEQGRGARQPQQQPYQAPNTAAFAGGAAAPIPDQRAVRARLIDRTYQRSYDLAGTHLTIGRESGNDIKVQDVNASRRHAELTLNAQGLWVITDLRSMNGTLVNGVSVASQPLYPGDIVTIGKSDFEFALA